MNRLTSATLLAAFGCSALAGPPYLTDDPEPVPFHHWEAYVAIQGSQSHEGALGGFPFAELNYGATHNIHVHLGVPFTLIEPDDGPVEYGFGDMEVGAKIRVLPERSDSPMVGIYPLVVLPTGRQSKGLGNGETQFYLPVWFQKRLGDWLTYGGGGYWRHPGQGNRDYWFAGWQAQKQVTESMTVGAELFFTTPDSESADDRIGFNIGSTYDLVTGHHLLLSLGRDLHGPNDFLMYFGMQWTYGHD